jgi:hypothetical protein
MNTAAGSHEGAPAPTRFSPDSVVLLNWIEQKLGQQEERHQITTNQKELILKTITEDEVGFGSKPLDSELDCQYYFEYALGEESALSNVWGSLVWRESNKGASKYIMRC